MTREPPRRAWSMCASAALISGCLNNVVTLAREDAGAAIDAPAAQVEAPREGLGSVDLLVVIDNSHSMQTAQAYFNNYASALTSTLLELHGVRDVRVAVVTSDLGAGGFAVPSCLGERGDDAVMNPRARGVATTMRPRVALPVESFCERFFDAPFVSLTAGDDAMLRYWAPSCHATVGVGGCGLEQPLEAARRALVEQGRSGALNAGFLRPEAALAVLVVSDEDDGSVRDCAAHDGVGGCVDARSAFDPSSTEWGDPSLNLRLYRYTPGGAQDPTWPIDRYVDPANPARGLLGLKPGHPERVLFAAFAGVPSTLPRRPDASTDWDALLGPPRDPSRRDDFNARDASRALSDPNAPNGPISMRQSDIDAQCAERLVPACRATSSAGCDPRGGAYAWRARRLAEVARRMDESSLCDGAPCHNGMVASICDTGDSSPFSRFAAMIARRVTR